MIDLNMKKPTGIYKVIGRIHLIYNYIIINIICSPLPPGRLKNWLLRRTGMDVGKDAWINPQCVFDPLNPKKITIENGAFLGWGCRLMAHVIVPSDEGGYDYKEGKITIKSKAFVGGFSTVLPSTTVEGMLYNNSLANKDVPKDEKWAGVPAKQIG
ncbi:MAG: hypothetical protein R6W73_07825 [Candidatus Saliniplasma sp.]